MQLVSNACELKVPTVNHCFFLKKADDLKMKNFKIFFQDGTSKIISADSVEYKRKKASMDLTVKIDEKSKLFKDVIMILEIVPSILESHKPSATDDDE